MVDAIFLVSVSILLILLVRKIFAKHVPARLLYALWLLPVLFMLLFCLPFVKVKENQIMIRIGGRTLHLLVGGDGPVLLRIFPNLYDILERSLNRILFANRSFTVKHLGAAKQGFVLFPAGISVWEAGKVIWLLGAVVTAALLLVPYVRMWLYLKRNRVLYPERVCGQKVYLVEGLRSSFLLCGKIYIDSEQQKDAVCFSNVVRHELTHRRHGDDIWNLVRTLCVVVFWFHPLVWIAAFVSKTDSEYACDEGVLKKMTAQERRSYGVNLLELATKGKGSVKGNFFVYGIGGGELKERIVRVTAKKGKGVWLKTIAFLCW